MSVLKCLCMHCGLHNENFNYKIHENTITVSNECTDLGITRSVDLSVKSHVQSIALKAKKLSVMIRKLFVTRDNIFFLKLYLTYERPLVEYCTQVWSPIEIGQSDTIENIQRRFTRWLKLPLQMFYNKRLQHFNLISSRSRRIELDFVTLFKIIRGIICISPIRTDLLLSQLTTSSQGQNIVIRRLFNKRLSRIFSF